MNKVRAYVVWLLYCYFLVVLSSVYFSRWTADVTNRSKSLVSLFNSRKKKFSGARKLPLYYGFVRPGDTRLCFHPRRCNAVYSDAEADCFLQSTRASNCESQLWIIMQSLDFPEGGGVCSGKTFTVCVCVCVCVCVREREREYYFHLCFHLHSSSPVNIVRQVWCVLLVRWRV